MIKYFDVDSYDENGFNIIPVSPKSPLVKTAGSYSPEIMSAIMGLSREPQYYYVVINAVGAFNVWGANKNGDGFTEEGLRHVSTEADAGTENDYGYKTFERYAKLFKHHVNKADSPSYGKVFFSHWNDKLKRVELVVGIDVSAGADIIQALEQQEPVSVSMGCRVKQDICSICNNAASTRAQYCKHLKNFMRHIVSADTAKKWSVELGRIIVPGSLVYAINDKPKFFDISRVHVGADRTAFILGKAASTSHPSGLDLAEAYGVTEAIADAMEKRARVIKISQMKKRSEIDKEIDGDAFEITKSDAIKKALGSKMTALAESEPRIPSDVLNRIAMSGSLNKIFSNMLGAGVHPKPVEFQRIVLVNIGEKDLADELEASRSVFDHSCPCGNHKFDIGEPDDDFILKSLLPYLRDRSSALPLLMQRVEAPMFKTAGVREAMINLKGEVASSLASMFAGLKMKASGASAQTTASLFTRKPWLMPLVGGGVYATLMKVISDADKNDNSLIPAQAYTGSLAPSFIKNASLPNATGLGLAAGALAYPAAYVMNSYNQKSLYEKGVPLFAGAGTDPKTSAILAGGGTFLGTLLTDRIGRKLIKA